MTELLSLTCLCGAAFSFILFNALMHSPSAEIEGSKTTKFFSSVWPGVILFLLIASGVFFAVCSLVHNMAATYE